MTNYRFEAYGPTGQTVSGTIEADSLPAALSQLRQRGLNPYRAEPVMPGGTLRAIGWGRWWTRLGLAWRARVIRQLATLLAAGIALDRALRILATQAKSERERRLVESILHKVSAGQSLASAIATASNDFKADEIGLIRAGEQAGALTPVLEDLSNLLERRAQLREKLVSALIYPAFLLTLAPVSLIIVAAVLVPNLAPIFENSGASTPLALRAMISVSTEFQNHGPIWLLALICAVIASVYALGQPRVRPKLIALLTKLPILRVIRRRSDAVQICHTLGSLLRSGAALQTAISAVSEVAPSEISKSQLVAVRQAVSGGEKLGKALTSVTSLDSAALQMIAIGEETNKLDTMLLYVAGNEEKALASYIDRLMTLLTPLLTVAMGLLVGGIVMSIMGAILSVNDLAAQ